jgi:hypothetical protein
MTGLGHGLRLARIDVVRMVRKRTDPDSRLASVASVGMFALLTLGLTVGGAYGARWLGSTLAAGSANLDEIGAVVGARGAVGVAWVGCVVMFALRAVGQRGTLTNAEGVLTVVPTGQAYLGLVLAEYVYLLIWTLVPAVGIGAGLAAGAGVVWPAAGVPLAVALVGATAVPVAYALGLGIRHVVTRFPFVARHKIALIVVVFAAYMAAIVSGALNDAVALLFEPLSASPLGWYADLALLGLPGVNPVTTDAAGAVAATPVLAAVALAVGTRIAVAHWFADPALAGETDDEADATTGATPTAAETGADPLAARLEALLDRPTAALVAVAWRRAARAPMKLLYAAYPLLFLTGVVIDVVQTGEVPTYLPYALVVFVAWAAGVVFTLNPLGDQGSVLSTTLLSRVDGRRFVRAHVLAGLLVAVPVGTVIVAVLGVLSPLAARDVAVLSALAPVTMVVASGLAIGIGTAFPRFEATNVTRSMEAVVPSPWAFVLFSVHLAATSLAAVLVGVSGVRELLAALVDLLLSVTVGTETIRIVAAVALVALLLLPVVSYRYAVRTFDRYTVA